MPRLNIVCNGMMLFNEDGDHIEIVIPKPDGHVRKFGDKRNPSQADLIDLDAATYEVTGLRSSRLHLTALFDSNAYVLLKGRKVKFNRRKARATSTFVRVPKPDIVRLFRASEPLPQNNALGNCRGAVSRVPAVIHDIVVLSYKNLPDNITVSVGKHGAPPLATVQLSGPVATGNWVLYSNETNPLPVGVKPLKVSDEVLAQALASVSHPTPLNDFLTLKSLGASRATTLNLSGIGRRDTPCTPAIGMSDRHLFLYHELPAKPGAVVAKPVCGEAGCSGAALGNL